MTTPEPLHAVRVDPNRAAPIAGCRLGRAHELPHLRRTKLRLHIDVNPTDRDQEEELERLLSLGARKVDIGQTGEESWHVLADPEGYEFCLLRRRLDPV
ncbi:VOC family protein [Pseudonocardia sp. Cha107L01]|jgi:hypothetical protein|uniref:VOC family protein n=1 Tax=Pseudonocardia sp. Cha107L01 TaxID=3457576 RepID=UPI00403EE2F3